MDCMRGQKGISCPSLVVVRAGASVPFFFLLLPLLLLLVRYSCYYLLLRRCWPLLIASYKSTAAPAPSGKTRHWPHGPWGKDEKRTAIKNPESLRHGPLLGLDS